MSASTKQRKSKGKKKKKKTDVERKCDENLHPILLNVISRQIENNNKMVMVSVHEEIM